MTEQRLKLFCDRVEEGIAVLLTEDDTVYEFPLSTLPDVEISEGAHYFCTVLCGQITSAEKAETNNTGRNKKRLSALFKKARRRNHLENR